MRLLLDTHIWIWSALDSSQIRPRIRRTLEKATNERWLSPISIWELILLVRKGRVELSADVETWVKGYLESSPIREAPLTGEVAMATKDLHLPHRDPGDAFLAATAKVFDLTLVTSDARLYGTEGIKILSND